MKTLTLGLLAIYTALAGVSAADAKRANHDDGRHASWERGRGNPHRGYYRPGPGYREHIGRHRFYYYRRGHRYMGWR